MNTQRYKKEVADMGCIVDGCNAPAELHHPRFADIGGSQRANDMLVIPLCAYHHRLGDFGQAVHNGKATFEKNFGKESELLAKTWMKFLRRIHYLWGAYNG